ncbi:MAG: sensor histidine kinase [Anaerolineae bacterium]|nr:sensor histidine kinase [Anaerolineae bacterium]
MKEKETEPKVTHLLYLAVALWLGYLGALLLIDRVFYPRPIFPPMYYWVNGVDILAVLALVLWSRKRPTLERAILPWLIGMMSVVPVIAGHLVLLPLPRNTANGPEATLLRLMPLLLMALVLMAWQYRWRYVVVFSLGIASLSLSLQLLFYRPNVTPLLPPITVLVIQTVSFLIVGYFINTLMSRLKQQQASLEQANAQLAHYASTLEHLTISRERNRMARELHDTLAHTLSGLSVQLETVKAYWDVDPTTAQRLLDKSLAATRDGLQETRRALKSLRASSLDDLGLLLAVRQLAESAAARADLQLDLMLPATLPALPEAVEQCLYRVAQEAIANVAHHANAKTLTVRLTYSNADCMLTVQDDGLGFDPREEQAGHFGLTGMRERAALVGGDLVIESRQDGGTKVRLRITGVD